MRIPSEKEAANLKLHQPNTQYCVFKSQALYLFLPRGHPKWFLFDDLPTCKLNKGVFPCEMSYPLPVPPDFLPSVRSDSIKIYVIRMTLEAFEKLHVFMAMQRGKHLLEEGNSSPVIWVLSIMVHCLSLLWKYIYFCVLYIRCVTQLHPECFLFFVFHAIFVYSL